MNALARKLDPGSANSVAAHNSDRADVGQQFAPRHARRCRAPGPPAQRPPGVVDWPQRLRFQRIQIGIAENLPPVSLRHDCQAAGPLSRNRIPPPCNSAGMEFVGCLIIRSDREQTRIRGTDGEQQQATVSNAAVDRAGRAGQDGLSFRGGAVFSSKPSFINVT